MKKYKLKLVMPIVVEGVSLEKYLVWLNEQLEVSDSIEGVSEGVNISILYSSLLLLLFNKSNNIKRINNKSVFFYIMVLIIIGIIFMFLFPSMLSVLPLDYFYYWIDKLALYTKRILFGNFIMTAGFEDEDVDSPKISLPKENLRDITNALGETAYDISKGVAITGAGISVFKAISGNELEAVVAGGVAIIAGGTAVAIKVATDETNRKINNIPDDQEINEPISPSVFDSELNNITTNRVFNINNIEKDISKEEPINFTESDTESEDIETNSVFDTDNSSDNLPTVENLSISQLSTDIDIKKESILPPLDNLLEYISGLDNETQIMYCTILFIIAALYFYIIKNIKNNINQNINRLPYDNKYFKFFIQYKNFINRFSNTLFNIIIGYCLILAFLCILSLIFWF